MFRTSAVNVKEQDSSLWRTNAAMPSWSCIIQSCLHSWNLFAFCSAVSATSLLHPFSVTHFPLHHLLNQPLVPLSVSAISSAHSFFWPDPCLPSVRPPLTLHGPSFPFVFSSPPSPIAFAALWLIYAIILSSSIRVLSLFWRLVNSRLMIYQILITACWKPHSLSWCMVMIVPVWLPESQQTHSFIFFFVFLSPPSFRSCLLFLCKLFSLYFVLAVDLARLPIIHTGLCLCACALTETWNSLSGQPIINLTNSLNQSCFLHGKLSADLRKLELLWCICWMLTSSCYCFQKTYSRIPPQSVC